MARRPARGEPVDVALRALTASEMAGSRTLFASFMGRRGSRRKTFGALLEIYRQRAGSLHPGEDRDDDLRIERFKQEMAGSRWRGEVVVRLGVFNGETLAIDGIHRGIAYLACVEEGVPSERLPALCVDC
jgi:hypothetical protein